MIKVSLLHKSYGKVKVLKKIDLTFKQGEINGIVGENGAGKTTLFRCIQGLEKYDGSIKYSGGILKDSLGFLSTTPYFLSKLTGKEYLQLMANARGVTITSFTKKNIFDLPLHRFAETYSTGMKKKLALTAILLQKNKVFILDEPFNGVDIQSNMVIQEILMKLKELNKTVILSSHIFSTLNETCDYLHHLKEGEIVSSVGREEFSLIEESMKGSGIANRLDELELE
ncbi:MAG: ABC-2 type transport system ATP-binding protein [Crocinitomicaceae bacterium]|jgi:ABC-2 type transport system ATP-binding protein